MASAAKKAFLGELGLACRMDGVPGKEETPFGADGWRRRWQEAEARVRRMENQSRHLSRVLCAVSRDGLDCCLQGG